jgi:two-component system, chemotaxis family, protein-glutamate methylesterase/glutaminase
MVKIVVVAASAHGLEPLRHIIAELPHACGSAIFVVWHIGAHASRLPELLSLWGPLPAGFAQHCAAIDAGHIYVAPPDLI